MKNNAPNNVQPPVSFRAVAAIFVAAIIVLIAGMLLKRSPNETVEISNAASSQETHASPASKTSLPRPRLSTPHRGENPEDTPTAQEIVAGKVIKFGKLRREMVHAMAKRSNAKVPKEVEQFFDAIDGGRWEEIDATQTALFMIRTNANLPGSSELRDIWRPIQEAWGAALVAHNWPAQTLLDYGNAILGSLKPGMIYAGGTDPGCFIPTMLNETADSEQHIVLTQNALADGAYLNYLDFKYGDRMNSLTPDDSQRAFQEYVADAQKRLQHDQDFPDEPKQLRPGEDVRNTDGHVQVSGQVAVMLINEKLFQTLMAKNPDASFAMEESFPFSSMYGNASTLGPVMAMGVQSQDDTLTPERASSSVDYWTTAAQALLSNPDVPQDSDARKAYSKLISSQAGLLADHKFTAEAEQEYQLANQLCPDSPEAVFRYVNLLLSEGKVGTALPVAENAVKAAPDNVQFSQLLQQLKTAQSAGH